MESQYQITTNGESVLKDDLNLLGEVAGLADDRVFAELFRMQPYDGSTVRRGIMSFAQSASGGTALVAPNGASGSVLVSPFRGLIGTRTAVGTDAKKNWRDIRSAISVGSTTLEQTVSFGANASGNPRWDLIYASVSINANGPSVTRKIKDPATKVITGTSVVTTLVSSVTLGVQPGTAAASPSWPAAPADAGSTYVIPIAYVRIPNGFGAASTVLVNDIAEIFSTVVLSRATGGLSLEVGNQHYQAATVVPTSQIQTWGSAAATRPRLWMPPSMNGGKSIIIAINFAAGDAPASDSVFDDRNWLGRLAFSTIVLGQTGAQFPWEHPGFSGGVANGTAQLSVTTGGKIVLVAGQTMFNDTNALPNRLIANLNATVVGNAGNPMNTGSSIQIYADSSDGGKLKVKYAGAPACSMLAKIDFTGIYDNA